jgi:acyl-[acyl-carrier-protein]-phospholipid O-acyltransferase/long-chain-fatty-acid--[acyl-carrier-protein] ligase
MQLHQMFIRNAKQYEDKMAIIDRTLDRKVTYGRALIASLILADKLKKYEPGFIGVMLPNSAGCVLTVLGALMSGRTPVMINYSTGASQNCEYAQKKCAFETIITSRTLLDKINARKVDGMVFIEDIMASISIIDKVKAALFAKLPVDRLLKKVHAGDDNENAVILFTSGSEKDPKAVQLTHANIWSNLEGVSSIFDFYHEDIFLSTLPFFHVFGLTIEFWLPIYYGMTFVTYANPLDFRVVSKIVKEEKCTFLVGTPIFMWGYLHKSDPGDFETVRIALSGADKCPESLRQAFIEKHGITLYEGYGTTETSPVISVNTPEYNRPGSVGRTLGNVSVRVENYETGEECAVGETGKILVKGPNVMKGYFDDFEQTSLSIRHGYYDTGDMGYIDAEGYIWHVGRLRRFVKIGGEMVSLIRVEDILERFLPKDTVCCVVEVPDAVRGSKIVAAVTTPVDEKMVLKQMAEHLPNIALPKQFVVIPEFPRMGSGKIDFRKITDTVRDKIHHR